MDRNQSDYNDYSGNFQTHRSERYRHPEEDSSYRSGQSRGGYDSERYGDSYRQHDMDRPRNVANRSMNEDTYSTSRNFGNMGSYGGAQGFGTSRGGQHPLQQNDSSGYDYYSGMGSRGSYDTDNDRYGRGNDRGMRANEGNRDMYDRDSSRGYQGSSQGRYSSDRDDDYNTHSFGGGSRGNYMGSGYDRTSGGENRGMMGQGRSGMGTMYNRGRYQEGSRYNDPSGRGSFSRGGSSDSDYIQSSNQGRTFDRNYDRRDRSDRDTDRFYR
ncbi:hypothetical protein [Pontibacter liquoris]|uniref:hypothetical protein n=1 Tax=Pontibacter liquoris TaxID=2905677 RepID=UPI001FA6F0DD|nr:hypothetical protein [Pontibacter liquoris]